MPNPLNGLVLSLSRSVNTVMKRTFAHALGTHTVRLEGGELGSKFHGNMVEARTHTSA